MNLKAVFRELGASRATARVSNIVRDERGLSTVEYVILLALIAVVAIGVWTTFGEQVRDAVENSSDQFEHVVEASEG
jgi:Flp pilus assembly pilin Flp